MGRADAAAKFAACRTEIRNAGFIAESGFGALGSAIFRARMGYNARIGRQTISWYPLFFEVSDGLHPRHVRHHDRLKSHVAVVTLSRIHRGFFGR